MSAIQLPLESQLCFIYALSDPRDGCIKYIGRTNNLKKRNNGHYGTRNKSDGPDASQPVQWGIDSVQNPTFDTAYPLTAGMRFTAAGNVSVVMKNGETFVWPVFAGDMLPIRGTEVTTANTTITNTQIQLLY